MTKSYISIEVIWDGMRVYRVPSQDEIDAIRMMSEGYDNATASKLLGMSYSQGVKQRANVAQNKLRAHSPGHALYQLYRLQILPNPRDMGLTPVLSPFQRDVLDVVSRLGLTQDEAHKLLGVSRNHLIACISQIFKALNAKNRVQALARAVAHGDIEVDPPLQLWRGEV